MQGEGPSHDQIRRVLASSFASWTAIAKHALSPTERRMARRCAGECLFALGIDEYDGFKAQKPTGQILDLVATKPRAALTTQGGGDGR